MSDITNKKGPQFRSNKSYNDYISRIGDGLLERACPLCADDRTIVAEFKLWRITENRFPYDRITTLHHMLIPKRHVTENELTSEELTEFKHIKETELNENYTFIMEALPKQKSIPTHFHLHLIVPKEFADATE